MKISIIYSLFFIFQVGTGYCQSKNLGKIEIGQTIILHSNILGEERHLWIYSPKSASSRKLVYPVIYLFDAESLFIPTVGAVNFLNYSSYLPQMPEAYVVGIVNTKRDRDMPVPQEIEKTTGAQNFYRFLSQELVPYINKNFSTSGLNVLAGHSQGGLFVTHAALQNPALFPFVVAMDAPMGVAKSVEQSYAKQLVQSCGLKYVSIEAVYGWKDAVKPEGNCLNFSQVIITGESHETMPYKGLYEGLKVLFNDYWPAAKDLPLQKLAAYYDSLHTKYKVPYPIPAKVLIESAKQNIGQSNKAIVLELLNDYEKAYGTDLQSQQLRIKANTLAKGPDERVVYALTHASPNDEEIRPYLGKWSGVIKVPGGTDTEIDWEVKKVQGKYLMESEVMKQFKTKSDFLYVNENKELVWGRKHDGGGVYLSIGQLSADGAVITGTEDLIGFAFPPNMPPFQKNMFSFKRL